MERVQYNVHTEMFRQTAHLLTARKRLRHTKPGAKLKILSFGSSIGEEVATLRYLFPSDEIHGCDIDDRALETCRRSVGSLANIFLSSRENIAANGPYDLIIASAVLCLNPTPEDFRDRFPASKYDDMVGLLHENLTQGGILVITNASYRFSTSPISDAYDTIRSDVVNSAGFVDVFARDGSPYLHRVSSSGGHIYRRKGKHTPRDDEDLADSIFEKRTPGATASIHTLRLAEPPSGLVSLHKHRRLNTDWLNRQIPPNCVEVCYDYDFCRIGDEDKYGYSLQIRWKSLVGEGYHVRPATWHPVA